MNNDNVVACWKKTIDHKAVKFTIKQHPSMGHFCGYCEFDFAPFAGLSEDLIYDVAVHGGITYGTHIGSTGFGFDCAHAGDESNPNTRSMDWLIAEAENMARQILDITSQAKKETNA